MTKSPIKSKSAQTAESKSAQTAEPETVTNKSAKKSYVVRADGWVAGKRVKAGDLIELTVKAAKYEPVDPAGAAGVQAIDPVSLGQLEQDAS